MAASASLQILLKASLMSVFTLNNVEIVFVLIKQFFLVHYPPQLTQRHKIDYFHI